MCSYFSFSASGSFSNLSDNTVTDYASLNLSSITVSEFYKYNIGRQKYPADHIFTKKILTVAIFQLSAITENFPLFSNYSVQFAVKLFPHIHVLPYQIYQRLFVTSSRTNLNRREPSGSGTSQPSAAEWTNSSFFTRSRVMFTAPSSLIFSNCFHGYIMGLSSSLVLTNLDVRLNFLLQVFCNPQNFCCLFTESLQ